MQAMAAQLGGSVEPSRKREFGHATVEVAPDSELLGVVNGGAGGALPVWMSHGDKVVELPRGFTVTARTDSAPIAAMENRERRLYGVQFHPEVTHTQQGQDIITHFARTLCRCEGLWT